MVVVNDLSASNRRRDKLVNNRNGFTYAANILILCSALVLFEIVDSPVTQFRILCLITVGVGSCTSLFYFFQTKENKLVKEAKEYDRAYKVALFGEIKEDSKEDGGSKTVLDWCKDCNFYLHGIVYAMVRVSMVVTVSMQPFYLTTVTGFEKTKEKPTPIQLALVPLLSYCSSLIFSLYFQQRMTRCLRNRFLPLLVSIAVITASSAPLYFLSNNQYRNLVYPLSAI